MAPRSSTRLLSEVTRARSHLVSGCVVLEMWSGHRPFGDMEQVAAMPSYSKPALHPHCRRTFIFSAVARDFMYTKCMAQLPKDRPVAVDLLARVHPRHGSQSDLWRSIRQGRCQAPAKDDSPEDVGPALRLVLACSKRRRHSSIPSLNIPCSASSGACCLGHGLMHPTVLTSHYTNLIRSAAYGR
jgi:hypothetical protein